MKKIIEWFIYNRTITAWTIAFLKKRLMVNSRRDVLLWREITEWQKGELYYADEAKKKRGE